MNYYMYTKNKNIKIGSVHETAPTSKYRFYIYDVLNVCLKAKDPNYIICEVEPLTEIIDSIFSNEYIVDKIKIIKVLSDDEIGREKYNIQDGVEYVGGSMFTNCKDLKQIVLPKSVTSFDVTAFKGCSNLEQLEIRNQSAFPDEDGFIALFEECPKLECIILKGTDNKPIEISPFYEGGEMLYSDNSFGGEYMIAKDVDTDDDTFEVYVEVPVSDFPQCDKFLTLSKKIADRYTFESDDEKNHYIMGTFGELMIEPFDDWVYPILKGKFLARIIELGILNAKINF